MLKCSKKGAYVKLTCDRCGRMLRSGEKLYLADIRHKNLMTGEWRRESLCAKCAGKEGGKHEG